MSTLHIVSASPFTDQALQRCLTLVDAGDSVLLIEDAVYAAHAASPNALKPADEIAWYALDSDLKARGITQILPDVTVADYHDFVALVCRCKNSVSWS